MSQSEPCGCYVRQGQLDIECEFHKRRRKLFVNRALLFVRARVSNLFAETHLKEMEVKVLKEIEAVQDANK